MKSRPLLFGDLLCAAGLVSCVYGRWSQGAVLFVGGLICNIIDRVVYK